MPTYEYQCEACGHTFDEFQSIKAEPLVDCPACQAPRLKRLIGAGGAVIFKGSGFYQTDYRSESYKKAAKADSEVSKSGSSGSSSSDASSTSTASSPPSTAATSSSDSGTK